VLLGVGAAATLVGGRLADRLGRVRTIRAGHALAVPALVGLVAAPSLPLAFLATALLGIALYLPFSVQVTLGRTTCPSGSAPPRASRSAWPSRPVACSHPRWARSPTTPISAPRWPC
jgi:predicted MFS family arabinose efflux permease